MESYNNRLILQKLSVSFLHTHTHTHDQLLCCRNFDLFPQMFANFTSSCIVVAWFWARLSVWNKIGPLEYAVCVGVGAQSGPWTFPSCHEMGHSSNIWIHGSSFGVHKQRYFLHPPTLMRVCERDVGFGGTWPWIPCLATLAGTHGFGIQVDNFHGPRLIVLTAHQFVRLCLYQWSVYNLRI